MEITLDNAIVFLKVVPGLLLFPFSIYFGYKKIGYRVGFQVTVSYSRVRGTHISSVLLQNHKDRPLAIAEIFGIQKNVKFQIEKPGAPFILKSLETLVVKPTHYSKYVCKGSLFEVDAGAIDKLRIFIVTPEKTLECKQIYRPTKEIEIYSKRLDVAQQIIRKFNDVVYGEDSVFAIVYSIDKTDRTSIIDKHGFIDDADPLGCNTIPKEPLHKSLRILLKKTCSSPC